MSPAARPSIPASPVAGERVVRIVEIAERIAGTIIDDAEEQARLRLERAEAEADRLVEARLAAVAAVGDSLTSQVESLRQQLDRLLASLEEVRAQGQPRPMLAAVPSAPFPLSTVDAADPDPAILPQARVAATQMAVLGVAREEMGSRLQTEFGIEDTAPILDAILGPED